MAKKVKLQVPGAIATGKVKHPKSIRKIEKLMNASGMMEASRVTVAISNVKEMKAKGFFELVCSGCGAIGMVDKPTREGYLAMCPDCARKALKYVD